MKTANYLIGILDILLTAVVLGTALVLLFRIKKTVKAMESLSGSIQIMNTELNVVKQKTDRIKASADSFKFFTSLYIILIVIKETLKSWKYDKSLPGSFASAYMRHSKQIKKIRI
ncbi:MAG: hypothetical protein IJI44_01415 [Erysipelotrichaceae bacterium]|nr:hypothetical protein [Erysipelotrichaceae bacterium]